MIRLPAAWVCAVIIGMAMPGSAQALSVEKEIEQGRQMHRKIIGQFGIYSDQGLQAYINRVGQRVAAQATRPEIDYRFTVLDDEMINAFAVPGGFIYITRGLLMHMNSESELAAVLGHEIAHVTEKHAQRQNNRNLGLKLANILVAGASGQRALYELGQIYGGVLLSGYRREFELEADRMGALFIAKAGYSPGAMLDIIETMKAKDRIEIKQARLEKREPRVYHGFLSSHPDHDTRYKKAILESGKFARHDDEYIGGEEFLHKLEGLAYGPAKPVGVVRKNRFFHPGLGIKFTFPAGWRFPGDAQAQGAQLMSRTGDAAFSVTTSAFARGTSAEEFAVTVVGLRVREGRDISIADMPAYLGIADKAASPYGPRPVRFAVILDQRNWTGYILMGAGKHDLVRIANDRDFIATIFSFDQMVGEDFRVAKHPRVQLVRVEEDTTMEKLAGESAITNYALDRLRVMNGLYPNGQPAPGRLVKVVN